MAGACRTSSRAGSSPRLPNVWAAPRGTSRKSPARPVSSAPSSSNVIVPSSTKKASEQATCRCGGGGGGAGGGGAPPGGPAPLHQREAPAGLVSDGLECHHVPARVQQVPLP